jgi:pyruvate dehydrogenase kinase 2/3/4
VVAEGGEDVTIKVSDEGGGIPRSGLARIWTYLYSTAKSRVQVEELQVCALGRLSGTAGDPCCVW